MNKLTIQNELLPAAESASVRSNRPANRSSDIETSAEENDRSSEISFENETSSEENNQSSDTNVENKTSAIPTENRQLNVVDNSVVMVAEEKYRSSDTNVENETSATATDNKQPNVEESDQSSRNSEIVTISATTNEKINQSSTSVSRLSPPTLRSQHITKNLRSASTKRRLIPEHIRLKRLKVMKKGHF